MYIVESTFDVIRLELSLNSLQHVMDLENNNKIKWRTTSRRKLNGYQAIKQSESSSSTETPYLTTKHAKHALRTGDDAEDGPYQVTHDTKRKNLVSAKEEAQAFADMIKAEDDSHEDPERRCKR